MKNCKHKKRIWQGLLALLLVLVVVSVDLLPAAALTQADIDALKSDAGDLNAKRKELEGKLDDLADDKTQVLQRKKYLDEQVSNTSAQIKNVEAQINDYAALITQTEVELADAQEKEAAQYELFCRRVRAMEEQGTVSYWSVLFKADSFTDLLGRLDIINEIMDSDQRVINDLQTLQQEISDKQASLQDSKAQSESAKAELVSRKSELDSQRAKAVALAREIEANEGEYQATLDELDKEEERIQAKIVQLSKELAAQQAAAGHGSNAALGGYIWPVSSHKISSPFGNRSSPGGVGSTNHKGVDIAGVGYSTEIHAAKAGTVIVSQYSSSYGNYVVVSHGSGNTTLYAHMSSRKVSAGQAVSQGDVLGITGSTGHSTGPHLHFEITENGARINPLTYLTDYTQAW
ncbi:peptidoglycan DD-metalloendopeptidase family protein [Oscillibacter sp.]|uniref:murein hydrolase activator EnvC family protein n=1 Tax=Oscillibacter sp. TaxID=1945593 RepID=UPI0026385A0A|nr:peptidoglycan DD-metalloendopeptidase family protein [Oscillibacter sp.]MDD3347288.1 peptidoglycan DD-metalloendopeptidase family protein [Oscillibacter sp.]